jgi:hypothetical protein
MGRRDADLTNQDEAKHSAETTEAIHELTPIDSNQILFSCRFRLV